MSTVMFIIAFWLNLLNSAGVCLGFLLKIALELFLLFLGSVVLKSQTLEKYKDGTNVLGASNTGKFSHCLNSAFTYLCLPLFISFISLATL
jgi:hypothetical protein